MDLRIKNRWDHAYFQHYKITDEEAILSLLPKGLKLDRYSGQAWISIVWFNMQDFTLFGIPLLTANNYSQINFRVYVKYQDNFGVYFLRNFVGNSIANYLGRTFFDLPYQHRKIKRLENIYTFESHTMGDLEKTEQKMEGESIGPGTLEFYLVEKYNLFSSNRNSLYRTPVEHDPWELYEISNEGLPNLADEIGISPYLEEHPIVHYSPGVDVKIGERKIC